MRLARILAPLAVAASVALPQTNANAVNSLAFTFPVLCNDPDGIASDEFVTDVVDLTQGTYAVTVAGLCTTVGNTAPAMAVGTPCNDPVTGAPLPCTGTVVHNAPGTPCHTSTTGVRTDCANGNPPNAMLADCTVYHVEINGNGCVNQAGTYFHGGGTMRVRFVDGGGGYFDNIGALLVTVVWTPL